MTQTHVVGALALLFTVAACASQDTAASGTRRAERTQRGDTTVVRTVAGSVWGDSAMLVPEVTVGVLDGDERYMFGSISAIAVDARERLFVLDQQARSVRVYDSAGTYIDSWGRDGAGPGEFRSPDAGLAILSDGRVVVRDPGNSRAQLFSPEGDPLETWPVISGQWRSREPFYRAGDTLLTAQPSAIVGDINRVSLALVRIAPDGRVLDTLEVPTEGFAPVQVTARQGNNNASLPVPWSPSEQWTWHPAGYFVFGNSAEYRITLRNRSAPLQIERVVAAVPIDDEERAQETARVTAGMRWLDSSWQWNAEPIARVKPAFTKILAATDGRVWLVRPGAATRLATPERDENGVEILYAEKQDFDVFEPDGTYLGTVAVPEQMEFRPTPVILGDQLWAVVRAESGEQRVVRYRLQVMRGSGAQPAQGDRRQQAQPQ